MRVKSLSAKKKELLFISGGVIMLVLLCAYLFYLVRTVANKAERVYTTEVRPDMNLTKQQVDRYYEVAKHLFPEGAPSIEPELPVAPATSTPSSPATSTTSTTPEETTN